MTQKNIHFWETELSLMCLAIKNWLVFYYYDFIRIFSYRLNSVVLESTRREVRVFSLGDQNQIGYWNLLREDFKRKT